MRRRGMTIGELARAAGVHVETVRYYQRRGLLAKPAKPPGGRNHYSDTVLEQIGFIRRAQFLGFTLEEIKSMMELGDRRCAEGRSFAQMKLDELGARVQEINRMRRELRRLVRKCDANTGGEACPFIRALDGEGA